MCGRGEPGAPRRAPHGQMGRQEQGPAHLLGHTPEPTPEPFAAGPSATCPTVPQFPHLTPMNLVGAGSQVFSLQDGGCLTVPRPPVDLGSLCSYVQRNGTKQGALPSSVTAPREDGNGRPAGRGQAQGGHRVGFGHDTKLGFGHSVGLSLDMMQSWVWARCRAGCGFGQGAGVWFGQGAGLGLGRVPGAGFRAGCGFGQHAGRVWVEQTPGTGLGQGALTQDPAQHPTAGSALSAALPERAQSL